MTRITFRCMSCGANFDKAQRQCAECGHDRFLKSLVPEELEDRCMRCIDYVFATATFVFCLVALTVLLLGPEVVIRAWRWLWI